MLDNINSKFSFGTRTNLKKTLPKVSRAIKETLPDVQCPNKYVLAGDTTSQEFKELNFRLGFVRQFCKTLYQEGGLAEHFRGLIGVVKAFKVANCDEFAEITKTVLKTNGIKDCDIFELYAKNPNSKEQPRRLDHMVTAIGIKKNLNDKQNLRPFVPRSGAIIMDTYLDGYIGTVKSCQKRYQIFGLQPNEILMLKPVKTYEPDKDAIDTVKNSFPGLLIN